MADCKVQEFRLKLYVSDFYQRREFYQTTFGWLVTSGWDRGPNNRGVMFDTGCGIIELLEKKEASVPIRSCDVSLRVENVWELWEQLQSKCQIVFSIRDNAWGDTSFCVKDPGGFELTFIH